MNDRTTDKYLAFGLGYDDVEDPLPPWATRKSSGDYMELYAQLPTRDGRKIGNAVVVSLNATNFGVVATIETDIGNKVYMTQKELEEYFYPPKYVMDMTYAHCKQSK